MYIAHTVPGRYPLLESNPVFGRRRRINIEKWEVTLLKMVKSFDLI
jgi:hypothetical protein